MKTVGLLAIKHMDSLDMFVTLLILIPGLCAVESKTCPASSETNVQDVFFDANNRGNFQRGLWHRIPCRSYRSGENLLGVYWYRGENVDDPNRVLLNSHVNNQYSPSSDRYTFSSEFSLVIKDIRDSDAGRYLCQFASLESLPNGRDDKTDVQVIGDTFPACTIYTSSTATFQQGRRQTLPCECASQTPDAPMSVVYWSTGEGVTTETTIIGARFSDGTLVQFQDGADYSINRDSSLTVHFLSGLNGTSRFWCHVFMADAQERNCYYDVLIEEENPADYVLQASATSFYLQEGRNQIIKFVNDTHSGRYMCILDSNSTDEGVVDVHVFGDTFPLDIGTIIRRITLTFDTSKIQELNCPAGTNAIGINESTVIWSYGAPKATTTTIIGRLNLPGGTPEMSQLGHSGCFGITSAGSLLLNKCPQESDVRYWCHVFPYGDVLQRSYVDVIKNKLKESEHMFYNRWVQIA